jgi:hypothetical protein
MTQTKICLKITYAETVFALGRSIGLAAPSPVEATRARRAVFLKCIAFQFFGFLSRNDLAVISARIEL